MTTKEIVKTYRERTVALAPGELERKTYNNFRDWVLTQHNPTKAERAYHRQHSKRLLADITKAINESGQLKSRSPWRNGFYKQAKAKA